MPTIKYSRIRESDAQVQANLLDAMNRDKARWDVKMQEAQTIPTERFVNPEPPNLPDQKLAFDLLLANGPMEAALAMPESFEALVATGKALKKAKQGKWVYQLVQRVEKVDSPYKGKTLTWKPQHKITKAIRNDGQEEWTIELEGDLV